MRHPAHKTLGLQPGRNGRVVSIELLGSIHRIGEQWWVVINHTRVRLVMKRADTEMQAIRLKLGNTQTQMKDRLKMSQSYYSKIESGVLPCPPEVIETMRAMLPSD